MKKITIMIFLVLLVSGCGKIEKVYDNWNYESLTNECGSFDLIGPDGTPFKTLNGCVKYADSNSMSVIIEYTNKQGTKKEYYWQGFLGFELDN